MHFQGTCAYYKQFVVMHEKSLLTDDNNWPQIHAIGFQVTDAGSFTNSQEDMHLPNDNNRLFWNLFLAKVRIL